METKKWVVEADISDETMEVISKGPFTVDELAERRIVSAMLPFRGKVRVYPYGGSPAAIDLFDKCPVCGHVWGKHFAYVDKDGKRLAEPIPTECAECLAINPQNPCYPNSIIQEKME